MFDAAIIGGGIIGCLIARELSQYKLNLCLLEKEADFAMGASGANSGIVHAGYDAAAGTKKARFNLEGSAMFKRLAQELDVPYEQKGSLVLAFNNEQKESLIQLMDNGQKNGVPSLRLLNKEEAHALEPLLSPEVQYALYAPAAAVTCPYSLTIAAAENAAVNGAVLLRDHIVRGIKKENGVFYIQTQRQTLGARFIVNAAGVYADEVSTMAGAENYFIRPRKGAYLLFDKTAVKPQKILFQAPSALGKGVLVTETAHGNLLAGPTACNLNDKENTSVTQEEIEEIFIKASRVYPHIAIKDTITQFAGIRSVSENNDFIIEASRLQKGFIHVAGISSPGLSAAPAIAKHVAELLNGEGLPLVKKESYTPIRKKIPAFMELTDQERNALIKINPAYGKIICRCEHVSEAEITACIRGIAGGTTLDGVKRRVRAGMGRCQGGFCSAAILKLLALELNIPLKEITKSGEGSQIFAGKTK